MDPVKKCTATSGQALTLDFVVIGDPESRQPGRLHRPACTARFERVNRILFLHRLPRELARVFEAKEIAEIDSHSSAAPGRLTYLKKPQAAVGWITHKKAIEHTYRTGLSADRYVNQGLPPWHFAGHRYEFRVRRTAYQSLDIAIGIAGRRKHQRPFELGNCIYASRATGQRNQSYSWDPIHDPGASVWRDGLVNWLDNGSSELPILK